MAAKVAKIESARIIAEVKDIQGDAPETKKWTPEKQARLFWNLFKTNPHLAPCFKSLKKDENIAAFKQFMQDWEDGRLAYPSNTARSLAAGKLALDTDSAELPDSSELK